MSIDKVLKRAVSHGGIYLVRYYDGRTQQSIERATPLTDNLHQVERARLLAAHGVDIENVAAPLSNGNPIRITAEDVCVSVFRDDDRYLVIAYAKGHPIVKSLKRIGRRGLKAILKTDAHTIAKELSASSGDLSTLKPEAMDVSPEKYDALKDRISQPAQRNEPLSRLLNDE